jgi:hypothetical protein
VFWCHVCTHMRSPSRTGRPYTRIYAHIGAGGRAPLGGVPVVCTQKYTD